MADKKISALAAASVPLTGSEVLPIVQGGSTVKVSVDNLTTGKAVSASSLTLSGGTVNTIPFLDASKAVTTGTALQFDGTNIGLGLTPSVSVLPSIESSYAIVIGRESVNVVHNAYYGASGWTYRASTFASQAFQDDGSHIWNTAVSGTAGNPITFNERMSLNQPGNLTLNSGNFIVGTAGKGIDFSANTHAAGMTSELLNYYEEGTWTPNQGSGLTVVGAFSSTGRYTRVGNQVTISGTLSGASSIAIASPGIIFTNIPYTVAGASCGSMNSSSLNASGAITAISGTTVYGNTCPAVSTIYFAMTYLV